MTYETFGWRELMLGLIYPAVLGTVLYALLSAAGAPAVPIVAEWCGQRNFTSSSLPFQPLKVVLLLITFVFYLSDYFYVMFTKEYLQRFFWYSVVFLAGLAFTVSAIAADRVDAPAWPVILAAYAAFMAFYFFWDANEWLRDRNRAVPWYHVKTTDTNERWFYPLVFLWEVGSFVVLAVQVRIAALR